MGKRTSKDLVLDSIYLKLELSSADLMDARMLYRAVELLLLSILRLGCCPESTGRAEIYTLLSFP